MKEETKEIVVIEEGDGETAPYARSVYLGRSRFWRG